MVSLPIHNRSIIDEIRNDIQLDKYYQKMDIDKDKDCDFYDDAQSENDYAFETYYE